MPKEPITETENDQEKEARINALRQLLSNSNALMLAGYEGHMPQAEFEELKGQRQAWFAELAELTGESTTEEMTTDILDLIENMDAPGGAFPESKYSPAEIVGAVEGLLDGLVGVRG